MNTDHCTSCGMHVTPLDMCQDCGRCVGCVQNYGHARHYNVNVPPDEREIESSWDEGDE